MKSFFIKIFATYAIIGLIYDAENFTQAMTSEDLKEQMKDVEEKENRLIRSLEPGTINYIYEAIEITIDKTKIALQIFKENEATLLNCFGDELYSEITKDYENKIEFLENEKPSLTTRLFFGDSQVSDLTFSYKNYKSKIQSMSQDISVATKKCLDAKQNEEMAISKQPIITTAPKEDAITEAAQARAAEEAAQARAAEEAAQARAAEEAAQARAAEEAAQAQAQAAKETNLLDPEATDLRRCYLEVLGEIYIDDPCKGYLNDDDDGFQISSPEYFAVVQIYEDGAIGFWNEEAYATHAHSDLGPMTKSGPCWKSDKATVCFWE